MPNGTVSEHNRNVGRRIRRARLGAGMASQKDLARQIGVSHQQVQKYESGQDAVPSERLQRIAAACSIPIAALLEGNGLAAPDIEQAWSDLPPSVKAALCGLVVALAGHKR